tara:strand:- start:2263 stop:3297 length:1035 start_codon:yes stop_codon:yes gene_type:complete
MESAIPEHLRREPRRPNGKPNDYAPPFPAWVARFEPLEKQVVMAYFGVQSRRQPTPAALSPITDRFETGGGPGVWDLAGMVDAEGFHNLFAIAYWTDIDVFQRWWDDSGFAAWWRDPARETEQVGWILELVTPTPERFETLFSSPDRQEGIGRLNHAMSGEIVEHGYWGSARDRLPLAQTEALQGTAAGRPGAPVSSVRYRSAGHDNLCLIRSGQDWSDTDGEERTLYRDEIAPVLEAGMTYLRDHGDEVGCLSCRFMTALDPTTGEPMEKTFGLAHFNDLANLESWAKHHPTHLAIFGGFMQYVQRLNFQVSLRLYHEVTVIPASAQHFEYIGCHPGSGLLGA